MTEDDIMHEAGWFWVGSERDRYTVYRAGITHSVSDTSYRKNADGLSLAVARCDYLNWSQIPYPRRTNIRAAMEGRLECRPRLDPEASRHPANRAPPSPAKSL